MKFDTILIGGGLSSLVCGIKLQKSGRKCLIVSAGQNALHFSTGTFGLLGKLPDGMPVTEPLKVLFSLPAEHPYSKMGTDKVAEYAACVPAFFSECGIDLHPVSCPDQGKTGEVGGVMIRNGFWMTPMGTMIPAWLAMKDVTLFKDKDDFPWKEALIVNFAGFLDFNTRFIAESLEKKGLKCRIERIRLECVENIRKNPTEMRSVNIARLMNLEENWKEFGHEVQALVKGEDLVVLPEVFGLGGKEITDWLAEMIPAKVLYIGTMPPSVPGIRAQIMLKNVFEAAGGTFLMGDTAVDPVIEGNTVKSIKTVNLNDIRLEADNFVLASGNLFGKGLDAYVIGSELGGCNPLYEGSGAGIAILTAMCVADNILSL